MLNRTAAERYDGFVEAEMRKEDRIRQEQNRGDKQPRPGSSPQPREQERIKGSTTADQPSKPQRQPGKLPLPD